MNEQDATKSGFNEVECKDWLDFMARIRLPVDQRSHYRDVRVFRGHSKEKYKLSSSWERILNNKKKAGPVSEFSRRKFDFQLDEYLRRFQDLVIGLPGTEISSFVKHHGPHPEMFNRYGDDTRFAWWALGRHHGLVTPLLDWTKSPYIAMLFAVEEHIRRFSTCEPDGVSYKFHKKGFLNVWELQCAKELEVENEFSIHFERVDQASRQKAQQGLFTWLNADTSVQLDDYLATRNLSHLLTCYKIPKTEIPAIIYDLHLMNIDFGSVYPDLQGASLQANLIDMSYLGLAAIADAMDCTPEVRHSIVDPIVKTVDGPFLRCDAFFFRCLFFSL